MEDCMSEKNNSINFANGAKLLMLVVLAFFLITQQQKLDSYVKQNDNASLALRALSKTNWVFKSVVPATSVTSYTVTVVSFDSSRLELTELTFDVAHDWRARLAEPVSLVGKPVVFRFAQAQEGTVFGGILECLIGP